MNLSTYQNKIVEQLKEEGNYIWTNEGEGYRVWIGDESGQVKEYLRKDTVRNLFNLGLIVYSEGDHSKRLFRYTLKNR